MVLTICMACTRMQKHKPGEPSDQRNQMGFPERASLYLSSENTGDRLTLKGELIFAVIEQSEQSEQSSPIIKLDKEKTFQSIVGFGGALTDASAETMAKLPREKQEEILLAYFDRKEGLGYSLCRTHINSCDYSSETYAYSEVNGDGSLDHFSIEHDLEYRVPLIKSAIGLAGQDFKLVATPWSPPAWMKSNNNMSRGGKLRPEYYQSWASYYIKFIEAYKKEGIDVWGITIQNEPMSDQLWESCIYSEEEELNFANNFLWPALHQNGNTDKKVIVWDHKREVINQMAQVIYDDPGREKYAWCMGSHGLSNEEFDFERINEWSWGEKYGESIIYDLNRSAVGWIDWNMVLDERGGPNHMANFGYAPVMGDTRTGEVYYMNSFYYMGHFSKFIRPGARRIDCESNHKDLLATAFINPDGTISSVVMNPTDVEMKYSVRMEGKAVNSVIPSHSIATLVIE